jgi:trehalose/maltose hydrolase-like predicted phosphorylase
MPCGGRLRRAQEGIEWLPAIGVSTVPRRPKGRRTAHRHADKRLKAPENWKPSPVSDFARHPYMLMNLGQRDEPSQDDSFLDREPWDFRNTPRDHYPLLLFCHPLNIYRKQVIKQADVVLAMFLLGDTFS